MLDELICGLAPLSRTQVSYLVRHFLYTLHVLYTLHRKHFYLQVLSYFTQVADMPEEERSAALERFGRKIDEAQEATLAFTGKREGANSTVRVASEGASGASRDIHLTGLSLVTLISKLEAYGRLPSFCVLGCVLVLALCRVWRQGKSQAL